MEPFPAPAAQWNEIESDRRDRKDTTKLKAETQRIKPQKYYEDDAEGGDLISHVDCTPVPGVWNKWM